MAGEYLLSMLPDLESRFVKVVMTLTVMEWYQHVVQGLVELL